MTPDIQEQIQAKADAYDGPPDKWTLVEASEYGYSLASPQIAALQDIIERLLNPVKGNPEAAKIYYEQYKRRFNV